MYQMNDLLGLQTRTDFCTDLTRDEVQYLKSTTYREDLARVGDNPVAMARLTRELLKHVALDPTAGTQVKDFVIGYDKPANAENDTFYFVCHLHCLVNFVGYFELPRNSEEAQQLVEAIRENLAGRKFKAATTYRRLLKKSTHRYERLRRVGRAAYNEVVERLRHGINFRAESDRAKVTEMYEQASAASEAVHAPLKERMQQRMANVGRAAFDPEYRGAYTAILGNFAARHIRTRQPA